MKQSLDRREFLKLAGLFSLGLSIPPLQLDASPPQQNDDRKNILIVVYDAFSAHNTPLHGYPRITTPNLSRLSERAVIYHNNFSAGNFTTPGTASLLTGAYPWSHRAFNLHETVDKSFLSKNIFHAFPHYHRLAYSHNPLADTLLNQFILDIEGYVPSEEFFFLTGRSADTLLKSDEDIAYVGWVRTLERSREGYAYSLFLSQFIESLLEKYRQIELEQYEPDFPRGIPDVRGNYFFLEDATDNLQNLLTNSPKPFIGYFHFYPPHAPYATRLDFYQTFAKDGYQPPAKPEHFYTEDMKPTLLNNKRMAYDEYLLYVDEEFGRLFDFMEQAGLLENTWLILTSDHGEMFERGILGHTTPAMVQPLIHVPQIIFEPGRTTREDVYSPTSAIDILPTLLQVTGQNIPDWCEGSVLPPFVPPGSPGDQTLFSMDVRRNNKKGPLRRGSVVLVEAPYKLTYYYGHKELNEIGGELVELYDIYNDPEELNNLVPGHETLAAELLDELKAKLDEVNQPYL